MKKGTIQVLQFWLRISILTGGLCFLSNAAANNLETKNPFLPKGHGVKKPQTPKPVVTSNGLISRVVEFRGIAQLNGIYQFSVFNKSDQKGYWLTENQSENGISVRSYDPDSQSITLTMNGRSERLTLMNESNAPLPVATSTTPVSNNNKANIKPPSLPPGLKNAGQNAGTQNRRRVIPRRRVTLPKK